MRSESLRRLQHDVDAGGALAKPSSLLQVQPRWTLREHAADARAHGLRCSHASKSLVDNCLRRRFGAVVPAGIASSGRCRRGIDRKRTREPFRRRRRRRARRCKAWNDIHAEGCVSRLSDVANGAAQHVRRHSRRAQHTKSTCGANGIRQRRRRDKCHAG